jgi:16S rRNA (uracil1498-N3)-methyltransferase
MRRFFLDRHIVCSDRPVITGPDLKHIRTVLRASPGDELILFDGQGTDYRSRIVAVTAKGVYVTVIARYPSRSESPLRITVGQALIKTRKMDRMIRQFTELGGTRFVAFPAHRSVVKRERQRVDDRIERWKRIARESLKQCGRSALPDVRFADSFQTMIDTSDDADLRIIFDVSAHPDAPHLLLKKKRSVQAVLIIIGPEGGFTEEELALAGRQGIVSCHMGPRVLKSDTAVIAALAVIQHQFGDMGF